VSGQGPDLACRSRAAGWLKIVGDLQPVSVLTRSLTCNHISNQALYRLYVSPRRVGHAESHDDEARRRYHHEILPLAAASHKRVSRHPGSPPTTPSVT
jgi:hypothetical protein